MNIISALNLEQYHLLLHKSVWNTFYWFEHWDYLNFYIAKKFSPIKSERPALWPWTDLWRVNITLLYSTDILIHIFKKISAWIWLTYKCQYFMDLINFKYLTWVYSHFMVMEPGTYLYVSSQLETCKQAKWTRWKFWIYQW